MDNNREPKIIAEIGCNHKGDFSIALDMIKIASQFCKVDVVKFQKRNSSELLTAEEYNAPHPEPRHAYGATYGEHREFLEFDLGQHKKLKDSCEEWGMDYSVSVWDVKSAKEIVEINPKIVKIPSASNLNYKIMGYLCDEYEGQIHVSLGMTTPEEIDSIVQFFVDKRREHDLVLYSCTSGYPIPPEDICLYEITRLKESYGDKVAAIGFSGHHLGIAADIAAFTLGAEWIERHFTLDRTWKGTDHAASLEPDGLRKLTRDIKYVNKALGIKEKEILDIEIAQRQKLKRNLTR
ncbi:MAG: N-acetylneuraminate synthase family protein [Nitrospinota bacterium]